MPGNGKSTVYDGFSSRCFIWSTISGIWLATRDASKIKPLVHMFMSLQPNRWLMTINCRCARPRCNQQQPRRDPDSGIALKSPNLLPKAPWQESTSTGSLRKMELRCLFSAPAVHIPKQGRGAFAQFSLIDNMGRSNTRACPTPPRN